jgi:hypothetical protein
VKVTTPKGLRTTNAPAQKGRGVEMRQHTAGGYASSSCVGRRDVPGPSTDCSVTDGLRWISAKDSAALRYQPKLPEPADLPVPASLCPLNSREPGRTDQTGLGTQLGRHHRQAA